MDWTFTSTALTMADFIRMENYYNEIEAQHCWTLFDHWLDNVVFSVPKNIPMPVINIVYVKYKLNSLR